MNALSRRRLRSILGWTIAALVLAAGVGWWVRGRAEADEGRWRRVERGALVVSIETSGTLRAAESVFLSPPQLAHRGNFKISFMAPEGTEVVAGMPVLAFDTSDLERQLLDRSAASEQAAKQVEKLLTEVAKRASDHRLKVAEAEARRRKLALQADVPAELSKAKDLAATRIDLQLVEKELAYLAKKSALEERASQEEISALREQRARALARVHELRQDIAKLSIASPRAGTVIYVNNYDGSKKKVGDSVWQGSQILEIPDLSRMLADGEVDEADVGRLAVGQRVTLRLDAHPEIEYEGRVRRIGQTVQRRSAKNRLKIVKIEIEFSETDAKHMRPGMRFQGEVEIERRDDALLLPASAVEMTAQGPVVYRRSGLGVERISPQLGLRGGEQVEVLAGLAEGDEVQSRLTGAVP